MTKTLASGIADYDPAATLARAELTQQGAALLQDYLTELAKSGYVKVAIDTWRNPADTHNIRHSYRNGEWTLLVWTDGGGQVEVRWGIRATMPDVRMLLTATLPPAF